MSKNLKRTNWPRPIIQWGVLLSIIVAALVPKFNANYVPDFESYCPFGGIQALGSYLLNQALSCSMTSAQIVMGLTLMIAIIIFSKLFCSFICPIGTISEWIGRLGDSLRIRITIKGITDKILRSLKYILLFITLYFTFQSNELFCKKFDPYFSVATNFGADVVLLYAVVSIVLVILGSVFIRLFWCKYICPLGAISNIFQFSLFFIGVMAIYILLIVTGINISYIWPLIIVCLGGYIIELTGIRIKGLPGFNITRNEDTCIDCQRCSKKCPQGIDVASLKVVRDIDCNLCGDCMAECPVSNTLQINKKRQLRWLAPIAVVTLTVVGIFIGTLWEVPTIDQKWFDQEVMAKAEIFTQSGLKNIKCYGSSMAFASKMKQMNGVLGVSTYVKHHRVKIYYDPKVITAAKIQESLFTPSKTILTPLKDSNIEVKEVTVWLENFFDSFDFSYLSRLLIEKSNAVGLISEYDCPVMVKIYFASDETVNEKELIAILESKTLTYKVQEKEETIELGYKVVKGPEYKTLSKEEYSSKLFKPYEAQFNRFTTYDSTVVKVYNLPLGENKENKGKLNYLVSHLSNNNGIIAFRTYMNLDEEQIAISYVDTITNAEAIIQLLKSDTLYYNMSNGKTGKIKNIFQFGLDDIQK